MTETDTGSDVHIRTKYTYKLGIIGVFAAIISMFMMYIALDHNPMGEFREYPDHPGAREGQINWSHLLELGFFWFIGSFVAILLIVLIANVGYKLISG